MKAASGELNLTVITVIAIGAVAAFFLYTLWPTLQNRIQSQVDDVAGINCDSTTGGNCASSGP